jgi:hypothetical protein
MQSTPYDVKRLEYQLRFDAATRCPRTFPDEPAAFESDASDEPNVTKASLLHRVATTFAVLLRRRAHAEAR